MCSVRVLATSATTEQRRPRRRLFPCHWLERRSLGTYISRLHIYVCMYQLSMYVQGGCTPGCLSVSPYTGRSVGPFSGQSVGVSVSLSACLYVGLYARPSVRPFVRPSECFVSVHSILAVHDGYICYVCNVRTCCQAGKQLTKCGESAGALSKNMLSRAGSDGEKHLRQLIHR